MRLRILALAIVLAACGQQSASQPAPAPVAEPAASFPKPDRPVAEIVSPIWSSGPDRDAADENGQIVRAMGIRAGMTVADIGAGSGYHSIRLSPVVGPTGRVYGQDVMATYLRGLEAEARLKGLTNVTTVVGTPSDPKLPAGSVDAAILVHMYHEIQNPFALLWNLVPSLKPGARVGIIDLDRATENHGTPPALLKCEMEAAGYRQVSFAQLTGGVGYIAIYAPPALNARPAPSSIRACRSR